MSTMDTVKVRELPKKAKVNMFDRMIVEDNDGTKTVLVQDIRHFLQANSYFDTVEDMKKAYLYEGDIVTTLGYREVNDGGGATYKIVYAPTDLDDGQLVHYLYTSDTLRAHLMHNGTLDILQCGARGDGETDDHDAIMNALKTGYEVSFPRRHYFLGSPLELISDTVLDFNGSTLISPYSAAIALGADLPLTNTIIKNANFSGQYGIELYSHASYITIESCTFKGYKDQRMEEAIQIFGATNIKIMHCDIGSHTDEVCRGISIKTGTLLDGTSVGNDTIMASNNRIYCSDACIYMSNSVTDKHIVISDNIIIGFGVNRNAVTAVGIYIANRCETLVISGASLHRLFKGIDIVGTANMSVSLTDISTDDTHIMYNVSNADAKVHLSGFQKHNGSDYEQADYIFDNMSGTLFLNTTIDLSPRSSIKKIIQFKTRLDGKLVDSIPLHAKTTANIFGDGNHNNDADNVVPGYMNVCINMDFEGTINQIEFPSLSGQTICVYSTKGLILRSSNYLKLGDDYVTLSPVNGLILTNVNGMWYRGLGGGNNAYYDYR